MRDRVVGWLEPWHDPVGRGFQFVQADYALAAGGLFGESSPIVPARVPEVHTDFILVGVASQWGLTGVVAVLALSCVIVCRCVSAALNAAEWFSLLAGDGDGHVDRCSGAVDFGWHVEGLATDRAHRSTRFIRWNVDGRHSICTRDRGRPRNIRRQRIMNPEAGGSRRATVCNFRRNCAMLWTVAIRPEGCLHWE